MTGHFEEIPEDRRESYPCYCGGSLTKNESATWWGCDECDFAKEIMTEKFEEGVDKIIGYNTKETNPKESVGIRKWRYFSTIPFTVMAEIGMALVEGARKYGRHNYRVTGVKASVYVDASVGHIAQWYEGEDVDKDSGLSHIVKAIASLVILRDAMLQEKLVDDRPPKGNLDKVRTELQSVVDKMFEKYPESVQAFTQKGCENEKPAEKTPDGLKPGEAVIVPSGSNYTREQLEDYARLINKELGKN